MGVWGTSLYSGDFALDLRAAVSAVARLPYEPAKLVDILCEQEPTAARYTDDEDYTTFWLVLADQFAKRGLLYESLRERALAIIDAGDDEAMLHELGMTPANLRKRTLMLAELRARIVAGSVSQTSRKVLKQPQPLLMEVGDVLVYPTENGHCFNPYIPTRGAEGERYWSKRVPDGWAAMVIVDRGRAFDFLSWYRPVVLVQAMTDKPGLGAIRGDVLWRLRRPATCSATHFKRMRIESIGRVQIDRKQLHQALPRLWLTIPGTSSAVSDISIANCMDSLRAGTPLDASALPPRLRGDPILRRLDQILIS